MNFLCKKVKYNILFFASFHCADNASLIDDVVLHVGRDSTFILFLILITFHPMIFYFEGRPDSMAVALPVGSQVCDIFWKDLKEEEGGGAQRPVLTLQLKRFNCPLN